MATMLSQILTIHEINEINTCKGKGEKLPPEHHRTEPMNTIVVSGQGIINHALDVFFLFREVKTMREQLTEKTRIRESQR